MDFLTNGSIPWLKIPAPFYDLIEQSFNKNPILKQKKYGLFVVEGIEKSPLSTQDDISLLEHSPQ